MNRPPLTPAFRRAGAALLGTAAMAIGLAAVPVEAQWTTQPTMIGDSAVTVVRGSESWVSVAWTAPSEMQNFRLEVKEWQAGTELSYADGADAAYLRDDSTLSAGEIDTASFKLSTSDATPSQFFVQIVAVWEFEGQTYRFSAGGIDVSLVNSDGEQYELLTTSAQAASTGDGHDNWVEVGFIGLAPMTSNLSVTVEGGPEIYYPQDTFTSLHHDAYLNGGEEDVARFWIDPVLLDPGTQELTVRVRYEQNGQTVEATHPLTLNVS